MSRHGGIRQLSYTRGWVDRPSDAAKLKPFVIAGGSIPDQVRAAIEAIRETQPHDGAGRMPHQIEHEPLHYLHMRIEFRDEVREYTIWNRHRHALFGLRAPDVQRVLGIADAIESSCKPPQAPLYDLSLSYAGSDLHLADSVVHLLSRADTTVFWDHGGRTNPTLATVPRLIHGLLQPLIEGGRILCLIGTRGAIASHWVHAELSVAVSARKPIFAWLPCDETSNCSQELPDVPAEQLRATSDANADLVASDSVVAHCEHPRAELAGAVESMAAVARIVRDMAARELDTDPLSVRRHLERLQRMGGS